MTETNHRWAVLRRDGAALVVGPGAPDGLPAVLHWGADLGELSDETLEALRLAAAPAVPHSSIDVPRWLSLAPGQDDSWEGTPALALHRNGRGIHPRWTRVRLAQDDCGHATVTAADALNGLSWRMDLELAVGGILRVRQTVTNTLPGQEALTLDGAQILLPLPDTATEVLDTTGRHCREHTPQRRAFGHGTTLRASRRGRTGHDATLLLFAGSAGFGFRSGEVWGVHVAWSGNHAHFAERLPERAGQSSAVIGGGELLAAGEIVLAADESYTSPWVSFVYSGCGLDGAAAAMHRWLRERPGHPRSARPLVVNTWEGVYFDHDLSRLLRLADAAAKVGAERFVLDDGWFRNRRDDRAGLGDWTIDPEVWPSGLAPLFDHVRALGMEPGLWVEPEMANPDSDLVREHPDWFLAPADRLPASWRYQHVLDLSRPEVYDYLVASLDAVITAERPGYLKWDHNRDVIAALSRDGHAGVHRQTDALYRLLDDLRARHPGLEIESCASGGARVDLGILEHTDRVWASDTNDPLERQRLQRWTAQLIPPELLGAHVGPAISHTTGRYATLQFRCLTALFGHAGMELDLSGLEETELEQLARWALRYKEFRGLIHTGTMVRSDHPDPSVWVHGAVSAERDEAVFAVVKMDTSAEDRSDRIRLPGLDATRTYRVSLVPELTDAGHSVAPPQWILDGGQLVAPGAVLAHAGFAIPVLYPQTGMLLHVRAIEADVR
ncbi:alpha-galactosidase [Gordonia sp. PKS22-38]|uniref:alpha-galactosidase n=1 Tax=Gordonia prachuapensis TaxID=3115651 RepID=A0ABU7MSQ6_9ACTN|nr:alpha-galactosidase [Gordonia sp. PKS22-38]